MQKEKNRNGTKDLYPFQAELIENIFVCSSEKFPPHEFLITQIEDKLDFAHKVRDYIKKHSWDDFYQLTLHTESGAKSFYNELMRPLTDKEYRQKTFDIKNFTFDYNLKEWAHLCKEVYFPKRITCSNGTIEIDYADTTNDNKNGFFSVPLKEDVCRQLLAELDESDKSITAIKFDLFFIARDIAGTLRENLTHEQILKVMDKK